jgi:transposase
MGIAWGLSQSSPAFRARLTEFRGRGMQPIEARVALARCACRLAYRMLLSQEPYHEERYSRSRRRGR